MASSSFFGKEIVITHAFLKKIDWIPAGEIEIADRRMQAFVAVFLINV